MKFIVGGNEQKPFTLRKREVDGVVIGNVQLAGEGKGSGKELPVIVGWEFNVEEIGCGDVGLCSREAGLRALARHGDCVEYLVADMAWGYQLELTILEPLQES